MDLRTSALLALSISLPANVFADGFKERQIAKQLFRRRSGPSPPLRRPTPSWPADRRSSFIT